MTIKDIVTGAAKGDTSSSNPVVALVNTLIVSSSKTQERLKEIPTATTSSGAVYPEFGQQVGIQGLEHDQQQFLPPNAQGSEFLNQFRVVDHGGFNSAWDDVHHARVRENVPPYFHELNSIYKQGVDALKQPILDGPPQRVLSNFLHSFLESSCSGVPLHPTHLPVLGLSEGDKNCIRNRSGVMARHIFADKSEDFINAQVNALLSSLGIDNNLRLKGPINGRFQELDKYWNDNQGAPCRSLLSDRWVSEFQRQQRALAQAFENQHGANGWASEFEHKQNQICLMNPMRAANARNLAATEQARMLTETMSQNNDPKFQNSKFLQFMSKMSRGELIMDDNQVKSAPGDWASEFEQQRDVRRSWDNQFAHKQVSDGPDVWEKQFSAELGQNESGNDHCVNAFSELNVQNWADEFSNQVENGVFDDNAADNWAHVYDKFLNEQAAAKQDPSRGVYVFSVMNPYVGHPDPLRAGQELFRKGLLSEAVLALEAEVLINPDNAEGWRLLGIAHAENDDDEQDPFDDQDSHALKTVIVKLLLQAIAAMMRAQEADPGNLEVLLALGVSHTNELEQAAALNYLYSWLSHHPTYRELSFQEPSSSLHYTDVANLFNEAAKLAPDDADVHIVIGVLYNLSGEFDKAMEAFETALKLRPRDYSLWNKVGATQANSFHSADAILAYQQALDLKPNYVRAWANMGISYANQGLFEESICYYVRALAMNPKADNVWQYLRISLSNSSRTDMLKICNNKNLGLLQKEFPL